MDIKVALAGRARSAYTGLIEIAGGAPGCEAYQEQRNLLLSRRCRADSIPELEIHNDEVQCSHGATSAPVDPEQLFYLQARGIEPAQARELIVRGFFETVLQKLPDVLRDDLAASLGHGLSRLSNGAGR